MVPGSMPALTGVIKLYGRDVMATLLAVLGHINGRHQPVVHPLGRSGMLETTPARASSSMYA